MIRRPPRSTRTATLFPYPTLFRSFGIDHARHPVEAVGARRPHHRAVIGVADRERLGERIMERDVGAAEIAHRIGAVDTVRAAMRGQPLVHLAAVPRLVLHRPRSEERRVGKECVSTCRSRWSPYHYKNKNRNTTTVRTI